MKGSASSSPWGQPGRCAPSARTGPSRSAWRWAATSDRSAREVDRSVVEGGLKPALDALDAQGLAPGVEHFRVERDAPGERDWRMTLRVTVGAPRADAEGR